MKCKKIINHVVLNDHIVNHFYYIVQDWLTEALWYFELIVLCSTLSFIFSKVLSKLNLNKTGYDNINNNYV